MLLIRNSVLLETTVAWSGALLISWLAGEYLEKLGIARLATYGVIGFGLGVLGPTEYATPTASHFMLADVAFGLILCELGFRFSPGWLRSNAWVLVMLVCESLGTFVAIFLICFSFWEMEIPRSVMIASVCMATSPVAILRVTRNHQSSGGITNMILNITTLNCILSTVLFKIGTGLMIQKQETLEWIYPGFVVAIVAASFGAAFVGSMAIHLLLRPLQMPSEVRAFALALTVILLTCGLIRIGLSPLVGTITFGISLRYFGEKMTGIHQDFGSLGRFLTIYLVVFLASQLKADAAMEWMTFGVVLGITRAAIKILSAWWLSEKLGMTRQQGLLAGVALLPTSTFAICVMEQSRLLGVDPESGLAPLAFMLLVFEVLGPMGTRTALILSRETSKEVL